MSPCPHCHTPADDEQRFCEACGLSIEAVAAPPMAPQPMSPPQALLPSTFACPGCASPMEADHAFCRVCGYAVGAPQQPALHQAAADPICDLCGAYARPGHAWCDACAEPSLAAQPYAYSHGGQWTAADHPHAAYPYPHQAPYPPDAPAARKTRPWLVAVIALTLLGATGGGIVAALVLTQDGDTALAEPVRGEDERTTGADDSLAGDSPASIEREESAPSAENDTEPRPEVPEGFFTESDQDPAAVMEEHWRRIATGDYDAAYSTFTSSYSTSRSDWVGDQERYGARVADVDATTIDPGDGNAVVQMSVVTRDAGLGDETCNRFSGEVLVVREGGAWRYRPRPPDDDPSYFQRSETGLSSSDSSCAQTFD